MNSVEGFFVALLIIIAIANLVILGYTSGYSKGKCEGMYGSGSIYEDGKCFNPITK